MSDALPFTTRVSAIGKFMRRLGRWGKITVGILAVVTCLIYEALYGLASCGFIAAPEPPLYFSAMVYFAAALATLGLILKP